MEEITFTPGSVPVVVVARVYGKDASWVRAGIISGWLPIGKATRKAIEDLAKLYRLRIEESKNELDAEDKRSRRTLESEASIREHEIKQSQLDEQIKADVQDEQFKSCQLNEQMKDRYFKVGIAAAELLIPLMFYGIWMRKGFKFEETGTYTSTTFRGLFNRFRPTKK